MPPLTISIAVGLALSAMSMLIASGQEPRKSRVQPLDLAERLAAGQLRAVNAEITPLPGTRAVHVSTRGGKGLAWIEDSDFGQGTIELEVRGRNVSQQSFVGVAFHRRDDSTYEAVYLRPFNFRSTDPARRMRAVQYIALPEYDWPKLRQDFPEEFENPVDASIDPDGWVRLRVVVGAKNIQVFVGQVTSPTLEVRRLGGHDRGMVGLWIDVAHGDFANVRLIP